jgi:hypothetical protein
VICKDFPSTEFHFFFAGDIVPEGMKIIYDHNKIMKWGLIELRIDIDALTITSNHQHQMELI